MIHINHFYNLELIEFKAYNAPACISIPFSNLGWFIQKIITYNLGQNCWDKIENLFFSEKTPLPPPNQCCSQSFSLLAKNLVRFNVDIRGRGQNLEFEKLSHFLNLLDFQLLSQQVLSWIVANEIVLCTCLHCSC